MYMILWGVGFAVGFFAPLVDSTKGGKASTPCPVSVVTCLDLKFPLCRLVVVVGIVCRRSNPRDKSPVIHPL